MGGAGARTSSWPGWLSIGLALVLAVGAGWSYRASTERGDPDDLHELLDAERLIESRWSFERAGVRVLVLEMLDASDPAVERREEREAAYAQVARAHAEIEALADGDGPTALRAAAIVEAIGDVADWTNRDPYDLYSAVDDVRWATDGLPADGRLDAVFELGFAAVLPDHMLVEAIAGAADVDGREIDPDLAGYFGQITVVVRNEGGWLAADPPTPLSDSEWFDIDHAQEVFPDQTATVEALIASTDLVALDHWMRELGASSTPPPFPIEQMVPVADLTRAGVAGVVDPLLTDEVTVAIERLEDESGTRTTWLALAVGSGVAALALAGFGLSRLVSARRATRRLSDLALRDALTGVGNRHALDPVTRACLADERYRHHALAIVDLDRFKMVNDLYGHAAGDAVLVEVGARLQGCVAAVAAEAGDARGDVIRLGGDEFLVGLHSTGELPLDLLRVELDRARTEPMPVVVGDGIEQLVPDFSVGIADVAGPGDLDELMTAADLGAYADKERRAVEREVQARLLPPPDPGRRVDLAPPAV